MSFEEGPFLTRVSFFAYSPEPSLLEASGTGCCAPGDPGLSWWSHGTQTGKVGLGEVALSCPHELRPPPGLDQHVPAILLDYRGWWKCFLCMTFFVVHEFVLGGEDQKISAESRCHRYLRLARAVLKLVLPSESLGGPVQIGCSTHQFWFRRSELSQGCIPSQALGTLSELVWEPNLENHGAQIWLLALSGI